MSRNWSDSPYSHRDGILGRVHVFDIERADARKRRRERNLFIVVVALCITTITLYSVLTS